MIRNFLKKPIHPFVLGQFPAAPRTAYQHVSQLTDNFDDNNQSPQWTVGQIVSGSWVTTGCTVAETNQRLEVTLAPSASNTGDGYISAATYDLTGDAVFVKVPNIASLQSTEVVRLSFGAGFNFTAAMLSGGVLAPEANNSAANTSYGTDVWFRLRHDAPTNTLKIDTAPATASDPPAPGDWVNRLSWTRDPATLLVGQVAVSVGAAFGGGPAIPTTVQFDGFNTATTGIVNIAVGLCTETNTALGLGIAQGIGLSSGTNTAIALSGVLVSATGLATATNTSLALAAVLSKVAGLSTGTNTALALGLAQAVGLSIETDTPLALSAKLIKAVGLGTETDASLALATGGLPVGISAETETALARPAVLVSSVGISLGTNLALGLGLARPPGICTEVETNYALTPLEAGMVGFAIETDTVLALVPRLIGTVGRSNEIDLALRLPLFRAGAGDSRFISTFAKSFAR